MYVGSKRRTSKKQKPKTRYKTRTVTRREGGDKVYYFGAPSSSTEKSERSAPSSDKRGSSMAGPIAGLALLGLAAGTMYYLYSKGKCSVPNQAQVIDGVCKTCLPWPDASLNLFYKWQETPDACGGGTCVAGQTKCEGGISYLCSNGQFVQGGDACGGECSTPDSQCIPGAVKCGGNNVKLECQNGCWNPIGSCQPNDCVGFNCLPTGFECDGTTLFFSPTCDPNSHSCQYTRQNPNDPVCLDTSPKYIESSINGNPTYDNLGYETPVNIQGIGTCGDPDCDGWPCGDRGKYGKQVFDIDIYDIAGRPVSGATVKITPLTTYPIIKFIMPGQETIDFGEMQWNENVPCGTFDYPTHTTDSNGHLKAWFFVTWDIGSPGLFIAQKYRITVTKAGKTVYQDVTMWIFGSTENDDTCETSWAGYTQPRCKPQGV